MDNRFNKLKSPNGVILTYLNTQLVGQPFWCSYLNGDFTQNSHVLLSLKSGIAKATFSQDAIWGGVKE